MRMFGFVWGQGGRAGEETLDRPQSNFDIAGIPTQQWSSGLFECYKNIIPSCVLSFFCPCVMWAQVIVRAQIPFLIAIKNSLGFLRQSSGYGFFLDLTIWIPLFVLALILALALSGDRLPSQIRVLFIVVIVFVLGPFLFLICHVRTAFRMKYLLPSYLGEGCGTWDMLLDCLISMVCCPCSLSQLARHVFQYDRWEPQIGFFIGDPYKLPPLEANLDRPARADEAGLQWIDDRKLPGTVHQTGAYHRQQMLQQQQAHQQYPSTYRSPVATTSRGVANDQPPIVVAHPIP